MKHKIILLLISLTLAFSLTACGNTSLSAYKEDMESFLNDITKVDTQMNQIDPDSEDAVTEMLECLDAMNKAFEALAEINVPSEFSAIESLADEASENMNYALQYYTDAFSNLSSYDEAKGDAANQYLQRALLRKEYISIILQGGTPEGDDVVITYEETDDDTDAVMEADYETDTNANVDSDVDSNTSSDEDSTDTE